MPKLILRCNYLKNAPASHLANYMNYISTREGVEKVDVTTALLPATVKQEELIRDILSQIPDSNRMHEYYDYIQQPTRENASEFITQALENNLDIIAKKKNYIDYLANRPRVERIGTHGLFSNEGEPVVLSKVAEEVANHTGVVWTNVISLRREDAERLGYDSAAQWQELLRSRVQLIAENYKIDSRHLKWYAAFHNESHHPHVHLVVYSTNPSEGYLTKKGIDAMRSVFAHDIFRQEFMCLYERKTEQRDQLKEQAEKSLLFLLRQMQGGICHSTEIAEQMKLLSQRLKNTGGKKVYGYLKADVKAIVNHIVDALAKEEQVAICYEKWLECQNEILRFYKDKIPEPPLLSEQKEFKSIKNMVIREAVRYGEGCLYLEDDEMDLLEEQELHYDRQAIEGAESMDDLVTADIGELQEQERESSQPEDALFYAEWTDTYKEARGYLYGTDDTEPDAEAAYEVMKEEAENGNAYAMYDMGRIYRQGIFVEPDQETAQEWCQRSLEAMLYVENRKARAYLEYRIGKIYQYGMGTEEDLLEAVKWFSKAAEQEHKYALYSLGMLYLQGKGVEPDEIKAGELFRRSHQKGNPYASYELGKLYEAGIGVAQNRERAGNCFRVAFLGFLNLEKKSKDDALWYRIGSMYLRGIGTEPDEEAAEQFFQQSAAYGNTHAGYQLARLYLTQEMDKLHGTPEYVPDYEKIKNAIVWLEDAAAHGNHFADYALGKLYAEGGLIAKDKEKVFYHLGRAAEQGDTHAQYMLGKLYLKEYKDIPQAVRYLALAAEQGNEFAAYWLGKLYLTGEEVAKNVDIAVAYLEQSSNAGNQYAQYALGKLYLLGREVPQDRERAYAYFQQAAKQGNIYAAYFLEHFHDTIHPDLLLMATRLMHHLGRIAEDDVSGRRKGGRNGVDRKLARKIRQKKLGQGHAEDDHEIQEQIQVQ